MGSSEPAWQRWLRRALIILCVEIAVINAGWGAYQVFTPIEPGLSNRAGNHVGADFIAYYVGGVYAVQGETEKAYEVEAHRNRAETILGKSAAGLPWLYPPHYFFYVAPVAALPYLPALAAWVALNVGGLALAAAYYLRRAWVFLAVLFFPASLSNAFAGQNGGLTAALMAAGLATLERRPALAGIFFGAICYKPQFGLMIPVALLFGRHWRAFAAALATFLGLHLAGVIAFGTGTWAAFLDTAPTAWTYLVDGESPWSKMVTVYPAVRLLGLDHGAALAAQVGVGVLAAVAVAAVWLRDTSRATRASTLCFATLLAAPYGYFYDLALLAIPMIWVAADLQGRRAGSFDWLFGAGLFLLPLVHWAGIRPFEVQLWPAILLFYLLAAIWRYGRLHRAPRIPAERLRSPARRRGARQGESERFLGESTPA